MSQRDQNKPPAAAPPTEVSPSSLRMIMTMGGIGLMAGMLIVLTFQTTFPVIERNKAAALERAIFEVVPGAKTKTTFALRGKALEPLPEGEGAVREYYACYGEGGELVGVALEASGQGFQDVLRILYGYSPQRGCVVGMKVLESKETPGLGDKIMKDPEFKANFEALDASLGADGEQMAHPITLVKKGEKTEPWQVEAITGATISSRAIADILRESTSQSVPVIADNMDVLQGGAR
jgi:electron transport complex protein RnfG